jgi:hypothetical protein
VLAEDVHLFSIKPTTQRVTWSFGANDYLFGQRHLQTPNEPNGMVIRYYLKTAGSGGASIAIANAAGQEVARLQGGAAAGINTVVWNTRTGGRGAGAGASGRGGGATRGGAALDQLAPLGDYIVSLTIGGRTLTQKATIAKTQGWSIGQSPTIIR